MSAPNIPRQFIAEAAVGLTSKEDRFAVYVFSQHNQREVLVHTIDLWSEVPAVAMAWARSNRNKHVRVYDRARRGKRQGWNNSRAIQLKTEQTPTFDEYGLPTLLVHTAFMSVGPVQSAKQSIWTIDGVEWRKAPVNEFDEGAQKWILRPLKRVEA